MVLKKIYAHTILYLRNSHTQTAMKFSPTVQFSPKLVRDSLQTSISHRSSSQLPEYTFWILTIWNSKDDTRTEAPNVAKHFEIRQPQTPV